MRPGEHKPEFNEWMTFLRKPPTVLFGWKKGDTLKIEQVEHVGEPSLPRETEKSIFAVVDLPRSLVDLPSSGNWNVPCLVFGNSKPFSFSGKLVFLPKDPFCVESPEACNLT